MSRTQSDKNEIEFITPDAFTIDQSLIGSPLAKPWKRLLALGVDVAFLLFLSSLNPVFLALVLAVLFFYVGSKNRKSGGIFPEGFSDRRRKWVKRLFWFSGLIALIVSLITLIALFVNVDKLVFEESDNWKTERFAAIKGSVLEYNQRIAELDCQTSECADELLEEFRQDIEIHGLQAYVETLILNNLRERILEFAQPSTVAPNENVILADDVPTDSIEDLLTAVEQSEPPQEDESHSIIEWSKGLLNDLGLGIGWSSVYFTLFVGLWKGQTPGKKLFRLRVVQLDATPITLWESFGRYGGYAAGLSTGLLGFLQIFWDPNRQAIQDKISATVVVDLSNPKRKIKMPD